jgi:hypothetical protein
MSFEACESSNLTHSVPLPSVGILGAVGFVISYLIVFQSFKQLLTGLSVPVPIVPVVF